MAKKKRLTKEDRFREAFVKFQQSDKDTQDYLELFAVVGSVTSFGDGLMYAKLEEIMKETQDEDKKIINYNIPIQSQKDCDEYNKMLKGMSHDGHYTPIRSTKSHIETVTTQFVEGIYDVIEAGGAYLSDGVKVKIEIEYDPEDK